MAAESIVDAGVEQVFDITIEDTHCFFANGILAHNCQHWRADTCQTITRELKNSYFIYGMSATPYRDGGDDMMIQSCFGKYISRITASELIQTIDATTEKPYLMKPQIMVVHLRGDKTKFSQWQSIYKDQVVENEYYNNTVANISNAYINQNRLLLILVTQINHGKLLESLIPGSMFISGKSSKQNRIGALNKLRTKDIKCIISTSLFDEGIDVKPLDTLILAAQGKSKVRAMQRIGRILRPCENKPNPVAVDFKLYQPYLRQHADARVKMYSTEPEFIIRHIDPKNIV
jgi:superfamily II DNA or RNA helicase